MKNHVAARLGILSLVTLMALSMGRAIAADTATEGFNLQRRDGTILEKTLTDAEKKQAAELFTPVSTDKAELSKRAKELIKAFVKEPFKLALATQAIGKSISEKSDLDDSQKSDAKAQILTSLNSLEDEVFGVDSEGASNKDAIAQVYVHSIYSDSIGDVFLRKIFTKAIREQLELSSVKTETAEEKARKEEEAKRLAELEKLKKENEELKKQRDAVPPTDVEGEQELEMLCDMIKGLEDQNTRQQQTLLELERQLLAKSRAPEKRRQQDDGLDKQALKDLFSSVLNPKENTEPVSQPPAAQAQPVIADNSDKQAPQKSVYDEKMPQENQNQQMPPQAAPTYSSVQDDAAPVRVTSLVPTEMGEGLKLEAQSALSNLQDIPSKAPAFEDATNSRAVRIQKAQQMNAYQTGKAMSERVQTQIAQIDKAIKSFKDGGDVAVNTDAKNRRRVLEGELDQMKADLKNFQTTATNPMENPQSRVQADADAKQLRLDIAAKQRDKKKVDQAIADVSPETEKRIEELRSSRDEFAALLAKTNSEVSRLKSDIDTLETIAIAAKKDEDDTKRAALAMGNQPFGPANVWNNGAAMGGFNRPTNGRVPTPAGIPGRGPLGARIQ